MTKQASVLLKNVGKMNPTSVSDFVSLGGFSGIKKAITMDKPAIIDEILSRLDTEKCIIKIISLTADETNLKSRLEADILKGIRTPDVTERSMARNEMCKILNTVRAAGLCGRLQRK